MPRLSAYPRQSHDPTAGSGAPGLCACMAVAVAARGSHLKAAAWSPPRRGQTPPSLHFLPSPHAGSTSFQLIGNENFRWTVQHLLGTYCGMCPGLGIEQ